ncbi:MAG: hypothetical protein HZB53_18710 [Chloroflexi bacterium]|nr:hypothetical protein [Chloroflexota bacterium]
MYARRMLGAWFLVALIARLVLAVPQTQPGYMDAAYYYAVADSLASGRGLTENFVWNYLTHPAMLPQPSNAYWMPLTSVIVAPFLWLPLDGYRAAQIPVILFSAALVPLTWAVSMRLFGRRDWAALSSLLMLFASFYTAYWAAIDSFALYALIGTAIAALVSHAASDGTGSVRPALATGLLIGLAHLTRADGFLWLIPALWLVASGRDAARRVPGLIAGYLVVMLPWFLRNIAAFGSPLPGGALFVRSYDDLFSFDTALTLEYFLATGPQAVAAQIGRALLLNLATLIGALHIVFFPLALIGVWVFRRNPFARAIGIYTVTLYIVMSTALSGVSWRGTMLHSLAAVLPALYVMAPPGLSAVIAYAAARRRWNIRQAERVFGFAFAALALLLSAGFYASSMRGGDEPPWNERETYYRDIGDYLAPQGNVGPVLSINPPLYWYFTRRAAIAVPSDSADAVRRAAAQFGARYLVLQPDHPRPLAALYADPRSDARFTLVSTFHDSTGAAVWLLRIE